MHSGAVCGSVEHAGPVNVVIMASPHIEPAAEAFTFFGASASFARSDPGIGLITFHSFPCRSQQDPSSQTTTRILTSRTPVMPEHTGLRYSVIA
jgi:hypothetical protein